MAEHQCRVLWRHVSNVLSPRFCILNIRRHVNKTGDIKDFVITEESGIAKGIRRVVAVTGHEAAEVRRIADTLEVKLDHLEALGGKDKDVGLKAYSVVSLYPTWGCVFVSHVRVQFAGTEPSRYIATSKERSSGTSGHYAEGL